MSRHRLLPYRAAGLALAFAVVGCAADAEGTSQLDERESALVSPQPLPPQLKVRALQDPQVLRTLDDAERTLFVGSNAEYRAAFGHDAPSDVQFSAGDKVLLYSAGLEPSDGYRASFGAVTFRDPRTLSVQPQLDTPGDYCMEADVETLPYALGIVRAPFARSALFAPTTEARVDCVSCDGVTCEPGNHCEVVKIECVRAPCPPALAECRPDVEQTCGTHPACRSWERCVGTGDHARCIPVPVLLDAPTE